MATNDEQCPHCHGWRITGCKFGCPKKQPPTTGGVRSYDDWAAEQKEQHLSTCEKCMRPWRRHACPENEGM